MRTTTVLALSSLALAIGTVTACSLTAPVGAAAGRLVQTYCATPELGRVALRESIAQSTAPNRIRVECAGDGI